MSGFGWITQHCFQWEAAETWAAFLGPSQTFPNFTLFHPKPHLFSGCTPTALPVQGQLLHRGTQLGWYCCTIPWWNGQGRSFGGRFFPSTGAFTMPESTSRYLSFGWGEISLWATHRRQAGAMEGEFISSWGWWKCSSSGQRQIFLYSDYFFLSSFHFWESLDFSKLPVKRRTWSPQSKWELCHLHQWSWNVTAKAGFFPWDWFQANPEIPEQISQSVYLGACH